MSDQSEVEIERALEEGISTRLLDEIDDERVGFHHALTHDALYHDLTAYRRRSLHRKAGEAIERLPERVRIRRSADLAYHFRAAGAGARALPYLLLAGDQAEAVYAHSEAERLYRSAVAIAHEIDEQTLEATALEKLCGVQYFLARFEEALEACGRAEQLYRVLGDTLSQRRMTKQTAVILGDAGELDRGRALLQVLLETPLPNEPAATVADIYVDLAWLCRDPMERIAACERAADIARAIGDSRILAMAEFTRGNTLNGPLGRIEEARTVFESIVPLFEAIGNLRRLCSTLNLLADAHMQSGGMNAARAHADRALEVAERVAAPAQLAWTYCNHGEVAFHAGDWQRAYLDFENGDAIYRNLGYIVESGHGRCGMGRVCLARGQIREASRLLGEAIDCAEVHESEQAEVLQFAHVALAERDLLAGRTEPACARLERLVERLQVTPGLVARALPALAWAYLDLGDLNQADSLIQDAISYAANGTQRLVLVEALRIKGMTAIRQRQWSEAETALDEALTLSQAMQYPYAEAKIRYTVGVLHLEYQELKPAFMNLRVARDICRRLGERLYRRRIAQRLATFEQLPILA
jgi:tetratricopeptide (TPR) repeat protein